MSEISVFYRSILEQNWKITGARWSGRVWTHFKCTMTLGEKVILVIRGPPGVMFKVDGVAAEFQLLFG